MNTPYHIIVAIYRMEMESICALQDMAARQITAADKAGQTDAVKALRQIIDRCHDRIVEVRREYNVAILKYTEIKNEVHN